jgi:uncharacterized membrane protein YfcA
LGVLGVPMMAVFISPLQAAAILLPILCLIDLINLWHYRKSWDRPNVGILLPAGLVGIVIGTFTFRYLSDDHIRIIIGAIAILFALNFFKRNSSAEKRGPDRVRGTFWGIIAGFVSFGVHAGAPPANVYLLPQRLPKKQFVGTMVVVFAAINYVKLVPYALLGQLSYDNITTSLLLAPIVPLGIWLGLKLHDKIDEKTFYSACYAFLAIMGAKLLYDGLSAVL